jgi:CheY-like chemotaxis protein
MEEDNFLENISTKPNFVFISMECFSFLNVIEKIKNHFMETNIKYIFYELNEEKKNSLDFAHLEIQYRIIIQPLTYSVFYLMLISLEEKENTLQSADSHLQVVCASRLYPLRLLVAEDNQVNQKIISHLLKKLNYVFEMVSNGNEVLLALQKEKYDIVLMDIQMPELDGIQTSQKICENVKNKQYEKPIIVAMTAFTENETSALDMNKSGHKTQKNEIFCTAIDDYLKKPISLQNLNKCLEFWGHYVYQKRSQKE